MRRWYHVQQQRQQTGQLRGWQLGLRIAWELGLPLTLLIGTRLLLHGMGAQSWLEGLALIPDFGLWLWALCSLMLLAGVLHLVLWLRLRQRNHSEQA